MAYIFDKNLINPWEQFSLLKLLYKESNLNSKDKMLSKISDDLYKLLKPNHKEVLYDDTLESPGAKFANMDLIGIPFQIIVGLKSIKNNELEIKNRKTNIITKVDLNNPSQILKQLN